MARRGGDSCRQLVVSVVGVSGSEREKGVAGVGKSCLCNRFVRPRADDYHVDHISVLSQTDFSGRVVNNDHFLYWGEASRSTDDGTDYCLQVLEQTEFIDDASFMPFKAGKMDPYIKRCCATKIQSAEKLMYICKNQLGIEKEYDQKVLPEGKVSVDGFVCVFDVSQVPNRSLDRMVDLTAAILTNCVRTKRPVVLVTTKNDEANEVYVKEAEKLCCRKEFKGNIPLVETSSHENVNVDLAFLTVAQLADRNSRGKVRLLPFFEAARQRKDFLDAANETYLRLLRALVGDYRTPWAVASKTLATHADFAAYVDMFGMDSAMRLFRRHAKRLKDEFLQRKVEAYMDLLPGILRDFFPDLQTLQDGDWLTIQQRIAEHDEFERYFLRGGHEDDPPWSENLELLDSGDTRIPFEVLDTPEAETVFRNHVNALQAELEMREMRDRFKLLLTETGYVTPGKKLEEVRVLFMGRESFDSLSEQDRHVIYDQHQKDITEKARANFMELLLEHAELFDHVKSIVPSGTITQEDIREITQALQEDSRYKCLDRLESERTLLLLQHLGFVHCPKREHCPAYPACIDVTVEKLLGSRAVANSNSRPGSGSWSGKGLDVGPQGPAISTQINLVLLGSNGLAQDLQEVIRLACDDDELELEGYSVTLDYRVIEGDVSLPHNTFRTSDFVPNGIVCAYSDEETLDYVRESLEKSLMTQLEREEPAPHPPIAILYAPEVDLDRQMEEHLRDEGGALADSLQCSFLDAGPSLGASPEMAPPRKFDSSSVSTALRSLVLGVQHRPGAPFGGGGAKFLNHSSSAPHPPLSRPDSQPDIRIIMCLLCGDPFALESVLSPVLEHQWAVVTGDRSVSLHAFLDECKRQVEVIVSSYHGANAFRDDLVHGFVLVYSTKRKASLATLRAFSANIPNLPIQILAVTDTSSASAFFGSDVSQQLMTEGNSIADRLQAHFMTTSASSSHQTSALYTPFFKEVWDKKPEIEQAFHMEDPSGLDDSGEGTLERPRHVPLRGSGLPSFLRRNMPQRSRSAEGSSSEIYETVPTDGSLGDGLDDPMSPPFRPAPPLTPSDDSDIYSHIDNDDEEQHLVKPSQLKRHHHLPQHHHRFTQGWVDDSCRRLDDFWPDYGAHMFTTGRRAKMPAPPTRPKPPKTSQTLKTFLTLSDAVNHVTSKVKDAVPTHYLEGGADYNYSRVQDLPTTSTKTRQRRQREKGRQAYSDSDSEWSSLERRRSADPGKPPRKGVQKRLKKKRVPIPVATPRVPPFYAGSDAPPPAPSAAFSPRFPDDRILLEPVAAAGDAPKGKCEGETYYRVLPEDDSSLDVSSPRDPQSPILTPGQTGLRKDVEKTARRKEKQRSRDEEKKKTKEEEKVKKDKEKKKLTKGSTKNQGTKGPLEPALEDFVQSSDRPVPLLVEKCVRFIEAEGLDSEGIYRVPGNKVHVEQLIARFKEDGLVSFEALDIPVNAAATALKDHLKQLPPLLPPNKMEELTSIASIGDRSCRLLKLKEMLTSLPRVNFEVLKFIFQHFVRVAENCKLNSMDSKNLAICWWPTLLHTLQFVDIGEFESHRPHIEDIIQTMIDQFPFLFQGKEDYVMV